MRTDTHKKYAALQRVPGAANEAKRKRFFVYYNLPQLLQCHVVCLPIPV